MNTQIVDAIAQLIKSLPEEDRLFLISFWLRSNR